MQIPDLHSHHKLLDQLILWRLCSHHNDLVGDVSEGDEILADIVHGGIFACNIHKALYKRGELKPKC